MRCQNEQRLEHDREVIPERQRGRLGRDTREHVCHADSKRRRATSAIEHCRLAEIQPRASASLVPSPETRPPKPLRQLR